MCLFQNLFHTSSGVLNKGLVGEGMQLHITEDLFLASGIAAEIRQVIGKKSRGMIFI